jgi:tetratricopeptide (TPR) repeat protein
MKRYFFIITFLAVAQIVSAQSEVTLEEKSVVMPTYPVAPAEKSPIFFRNEAYQGASRHYYPLPMNDQYTNERIEKAWKIIVLENEYIELGVSPEIGGKIYYATDKTNDYHFVYKNNVIKPSNIGMTGAWVSGGIEWSIPHHHRASTFQPSDYTTTVNDDGSKTIWIGECEPRHGMRWTIGVTMFPGKSYFKTEGRMYNSTPYTHTFLYWANVAAHTNENYQTIFPPSAQVATYHSKTDFTRWPISTENYRGSDFTEGVDISWWKNTMKSGSFFVHDLQEDFMGGYDHGKNAGTVHVGDHNIVKGAKLWQWGSGPRGQATEARLTEDDGPYVEIMVGAYSDNQPDYSWIRPYEVKRWEQYWYPVKEIGGFKNANLNGAVNLEKEDNNTVFLGYYATHKVDNAKVILKKKNEIIFEKSIDISPDNPFSESIQVEGSFELTDLYTELVNENNQEILVSYHPVKLEPVEELPEEWEGYPAPEELETVEELYLTGKRVELFYAPRHEEMDWYRTALEKDPGDSRTNTAVGNNYLKKGDYKTARKYFARAIQRLTKDYTRPATGEALYLQGVTLKALGLYEEAIDTLFRATWDYAWHSAAYLQLAQISVMKGDFENALAQINESLWTNARNNRAIALKASILRKMGDFEGAVATLNAIKENDPLDFRINNEHYLIAKESGNIQKAEKLLASLEEEMRDFDENYLELSVGYINDGLLTEAEQVLLRFKGDNSMFNYYLGNIFDKQGKKQHALEQFKTAAEKPVDYIFPHRLKTVEVLKTALKHNPEDGKAYYYIGNILYDKQPEYAIENWKNAVKHNPSLAIAYRNLGWGYYRHYEDVPKAIDYYEKAISLNNEEAIYYTELSDLYEINNTPIETRLALFEGKNEIVKKRDDAFIWQIKILTLAGQPVKAVDYLEGMQFAYREGSSRIRDIIIDAQLMAGKKYFQNEEYEKALEYFLEAQVPEEEAGDERFGNRELQVNYYIGLAYKALGENLKARTFFEKATGQGTENVSGIMDYYKGLSYAELGENREANKVFQSMVEYANDKLQGEETVEAGVIFGAGEAENVRKSQYYTIRGLGNKGLDNENKSKEDLQKAVDLSRSNLWAKVELDSY